MGVEPKVPTRALPGSNEPRFTLLWWWWWGGRFKNLPGTECQHIAQHKRTFPWSVHFEKKFIEKIHFEKST